MVGRTCRASVLWLSGYRARLQALGVMVPVSAAAGCVSEQILARRAVTPGDAAGNSAISGTGRGVFLRTEQSLFGESKCTRNDVSGHDDQKRDQNYS